MGGSVHQITVACVVPGVFFILQSCLSVSILWAINWRPWRIYSWIFARKWPEKLPGPLLSMICSFLSVSAWLLVLSPMMVVTVWGVWLIAILDNSIIGLAVIMAGIALLLAFYAIMLWWRTQWQSSRGVAVLLLLALVLLCAFELCAVYATTGSSVPKGYSASGFFFGMSAIALAINMLFICRMMFDGTGLDVDEYVSSSYKFAYSDCIVAGPVACLPDIPNPNELYPRKFSRILHLGLLYLGSLVVLIVYSILYALTTKEGHWLGIITSAAVIVLDWNIGICLFHFKLLKGREEALFVAGTSRVFLICFGVRCWYLGHCVCYAVVASLLLGAAVSRYLSAVDPLAARRDALQSTVIRLREAYQKKGRKSASSCSEGCGSSAKCSSSVETGQFGIVNETLQRSSSASYRGDGSNWNMIVGSANTCSGCILGDKSIDSERPSMTLRSSSSCSVILDFDPGIIASDKHLDNHSSYLTGLSGCLEQQGHVSTRSVSPNMHALDLNLAYTLQESLNEPTLASILRMKAKQGDHELVTLLEDKGLDPTFAVMLKEKGLDPTLLALLQRNSLDVDREQENNLNTVTMDTTVFDIPIRNHFSLSEELRQQGLERWLEFSKAVYAHIAGTPERAWILFTLIFIVETVTVAIFHPRPINLINSRHQQFEFGFSVLALSPVVCSIMAFYHSHHAENMALASNPRKYGFLAWMLSTSVGLLLSLLSKSSVLLGLALTIPLMVACASVAIPIWIRNGYGFGMLHNAVGRGSNCHSPSTKERIVLAFSVSVFIGSVVALGTIISSKPLEDLSYQGWDGDQNISTSPYASPVYLGWAIASAVALIVTGSLPVISWFSTYRFSLSSAICLGIFAVVLVSFSCGSYSTLVNSRVDQVPRRTDFLAALLPLTCIPAVFSLFCGLNKWKDDDWKLSRAVYIFVSSGIFLLFGAASSLIIIVKPWTIGFSFLLVVLLVILAVGVIHYWAANNFFLTRKQALLVCLLALFLALAAFIVGLLEGNAFNGASVGYFSVLFLLAGRALTILLSPPIVVYSPRILPVYVYDAHADCAKNVSSAFLVLYGIAAATVGWGVVASLSMHPPYVGSSVTAVTVVVAFGFAVSRQCLTIKMMEDAIHFLSKETTAQVIARCATKTRNALSGTYSAPQRSASSAALLVGDPTAMRDRAGNFVLPRADIKKLRDRLRNEEATAGSFFRRLKTKLVYRDESTDPDNRRKMCAHARILALEEAIDTEWVYMWDRFGGYLLLLLGLTSKAERVQDEVRLRLFLDSIGFPDLSAKEIRKWMPEDYRHFEVIQESYIKEKEMEEEILMQRREEEGRGKERRKALLEREERKWKEIEVSLISSVPNVGSKEAAAVAAAVRAVGGDGVFDDGFARDRISSIAHRIRAAQLARRAEQTGVPDSVCILDDEPSRGGRHFGHMDPRLCQCQQVTFSVAVVVQPDSGPVCLLGTEFQKKVFWEVFVAGSDQGIEAGQVGLRLITKEDGQAAVTKEWNIGSSCVEDGRWHMITVTIDAKLGEVTTYVDGSFDGYQSGLLLQLSSNGIWEVGTDVWIGSRPPFDLDAMGRSDGEGSDSKIHIMDAFLWGRLLTEDEIGVVHTFSRLSADSMIDIPEDGWQWGDSPSVGVEWENDLADLAFYDNDFADWDGHCFSGRKRKSNRECLAIDIDTYMRRLRKPKVETQEEIKQNMLAVELAVKEALFARGEEHFTDQEFPPDDHSLFTDPNNPSPNLKVVSEWGRPAGIMKQKSRKDSLCLYSDSTNPSDVCQGRLGDCWFLSAIAVLTDASRISDIIITPKYNVEGIYTVRFCIQGEWVPVIIDDWIPCESPGRPAFATSRKGNELWVSILEKAYAKLHGSYEALEGGFVQDALVDLTGGAGEEIDMRSPQAQIDLASGRLWSQLLHFKEEGFLLGAGSPSGSDAHVSSSGIVQGHAYSVLQVREVDGHKLVQIQNPWANEVVWNGPWSDSSSEWTERMRHKLKHVPEEKKGIFWMSWLDFQIHFRSVYICRIYPPEMRYAVHGQWCGCSAGGCQDYDSWHQNPQFRIQATGLDVSSPIHVFITLTQGVGFSRRTAGFRNYQSSHDSSLFYIGIRILKTRGRRATYNIYMHESVGGTDYANSREVSLDMVLGPDPRGYTIVPSTIHPGEEAPFVLSVFTRAAIILEPL